MKYKNVSGFAALEALLIIVILLALAGAGYFVYKDHQKKQPAASTTETSSKFSTYILTNDKGEKFQILFYKNSKPQEYNFGTTSDTVLMSPPLTNNGIPVLISLAGKSNDSTAAAQADIANSKDCTFNTGQAEEFSVNISSISATANFCSISNGIGYTSFFGNSSSVYLMQILPASSNLPLTSASEAKINNSNPSITDAETIARSFKPLTVN